MIILPRKYSGVCKIPHFRLIFEHQLHMRSESELFSFNFSFTPFHCSSSLLTNWKLKV